jgi:hypothetical protein
MFKDEEWVGRLLVHRQVSLPALRGVTEGSGSHKLIFFWIEFSRDM